MPAFGEFCIVRKIILRNKATMFNDEASNYSPSVCCGDMSGCNTEYHGRQRFRPWLTNKIDSCRFPGVEWIDRDLNIFRIPWKHGGKQDWSEQNSLIFKEWAVHTGRFRQGVDKADWPGWKTRFRCAMNKLPDIQEIKERSQLDGDEPYRVYQFLNNSNSVQMAENGENQYLKKEPKYERIVDGPLNLSSQKITPRIPETVRAMNCSYEEQHTVDDPDLTSDLGVIDVKDLVGMRARNSSNEVFMNRIIHSIENTHKADGIKQEEDMDTTDGSISRGENQYPLDYSTESSRMLNRDRSPYINPVSQFPCHREPADHELIVRLQFRQQVADQYHITNKDGIRLCYGQQMNCMTNEDRNRAYGFPLAESIEFPLHQITNPEQHSYTKELLKHLDRGLSIHCKNGDVYATRKCRVVVFFASPESSNPTKIHRNEQSHKIFDYKAFRVALHNYVNGQGPKPSAQVLLGFGQKWTNNHEAYHNLLISATIFHPLAIYELSKVSGNSPLSSVQISKSDEIDQFLKVYKEITSLGSKF